MQAVFYERQKHRQGSNREQDDKTQSRVITRKQGRKNNNVFKKKKQEEQEQPFHKRDKRCHSSHVIRFVKNQSVPEDSNHDKQSQLKSNNQPLSREPQTVGESQNQIPTKIMDRGVVTMGRLSDRESKYDNRNSMVFNKFKRQERQEMRQILESLKDLMEDQCGNEEIQKSVIKVQAYLTKLEENNAKLLEVNYFFQKEFNDIMAEKQLTKRLQKCSKNYCLECRYHLQKQNRWKQQKLELHSQISRLREQASSIKSSKDDETSRNISIMLDSARNIPENEEQIRQQLLRLQSQVAEKDEQYMILLKEFNYLDSINKQMKGKITKLMSEYNYLSIENRTLLNVKTKLIEKEVECTKYKDERDYFKKKLIDNHRKNEHQKIVRNYNKKTEINKCKCSINISTNSNRQNLTNQDSLFSLSSVSTEQNKKSLLQNGQI